MINNELNLLKNEYKNLVLPGKDGWLFLINDRADFLSTQFGLKHWDSTDTDTVIDLYKKRIDLLKSMNITYYEFIIPEKSIVYKEFLPNGLHLEDNSKKRPSEMLFSRKLENFFYLENMLVKHKRFENCYFHGDSHTNFIGSYLVYKFIINKIYSDFNQISKPLLYRTLKKETTGYDGDLYSKLSKIQKQEICTDLNKDITEPYEYVIKHSLFKERRNSNIKNKVEYREFSEGRPTFVFENKKKHLPKAVIFRDSTADFFIELLAEHFSRSVFIWHHGKRYREIIQKENPDLVLFISAERFMMRYSKMRILD